MPIWLVLTLFAGFFDIAYNFSSRKFLNGNGTSAEFTWWFSLIRTLIFSYSLFIIPSLSLYQITDLLILGLGNILSLYLFMKMHEQTELSVSAIITQLRIVWVPLFAIVIVSEQLSLHEYAGIFLIFLAVLIIKSPRKLVFDKAVNIAFLFSITSSIFTIIIKRVSVFAPPSLILFSMSAPATLLIPILFKRKGLSLFKNWRRTFHQKVILALFSILLVYGIVLAFKFGGSVSKVNAIVQSMSVLTGLLGIKLLKENKDTYKKMAAAVIVIMGIVLIL